MDKNTDNASSFLELALKFASRHELPVSQVLTILSSEEALKCKGMKNLLGKYGVTEKLKAESV